MEDQTLPEELQIKLDRLREEYQSADSSSVINSLEINIREALEKKELADNPLFKELVNLANKRVSDFSVLLAFDRSMLNEKGQALFDQRAMWIDLSKLLGISTYEKALRSLEQFINNKLPE